MIITQATLSSKEVSPCGKVSFLRFEVDTPFDFTEGQFIMIDRPGVTDNNGKSVKRAYSIGTHSGEMKDYNIIGTIVKKASDFGLSAYLTEEIKIGDSVEITGPLGHFTDAGHRPHYLFVGVGSGITPLYSIYSGLLESKQFDSLAFLYGERFAENLIPSVKKLLEHKEENIWQGLYLSQESNLPEGWQSGRINLGLEQALHFLGTNEATVFICGKPEMVDDMREKLTDHGIPKDHIHFEKY